MTNTVTLTREEYEALTEPKFNLALATDSYKFFHWKMLPSGTGWGQDFMESRGGLYPFTEEAGLQPIIKKYLTTKITRKKVLYAAKRVEKHMGPGIFNTDGWLMIADKFGGRLPLRIRAVMEGSIVPVKNVTMTVEPTHPEFLWLAGHFETMLMRKWAMTNVATISRVNKTIINKYLQKTSDKSQEELAGMLMFKLHDFGSRGVPCLEAAALLGMAHLFNFMGSDTFDAVEEALEIYGSDMAAYSIPATEHSVMTIKGPDFEYEAFDRFLEAAKDFKIIACVADSYNIWKFIKYAATKKELLESRGQTLVIRPDSGDPIEMSVKVAHAIADAFGFTFNKKGYKLFPSCVAMIYGDGIDSSAVIKNILEELTNSINNFCSEIIAFGMGAGLLQKHNRDTQKVAIKLCYATVDDKGYEVMKDPITDPGKKSKKGIQDLRRDKDGKYYTKTVTKEEWNSEMDQSELKVVFENGFLKIDYTLDQIRARAEADALIYADLLDSVA